jgi:hypothetical protein
MRGDPLTPRDTARTTMSERFTTVSLSACGCGRIQQPGRTDARSGGYRFAQHPSSTLHSKRGRK